MEHNYTSRDSRERHTGMIKELVVLQTTKLRVYLILMQFPVNSLLD